MREKQTEARFIMACAMKRSQTVSVGWRRGFPRRGGRGRGRGEKNQQWRVVGGENDDVDIEGRADVRGSTKESTFPFRMSRSNRSRTIFFQSTAALRTAPLRKHVTRSIVT